ncbi:hypothetical protein ACLB6G_10000 [Zhengella sp. ZM62]|uniref:hypothetical protein n=1 Tax=Zhengella sedimenti TaxID=3390035 RepID=UPI003976A8EE
MLRFVVLAAGLGSAAILLIPAGGVFHDDVRADAPVRPIAAAVSPGTQFRLWLAGRKTGCLVSIDMDTGMASSQDCGDGAANPLVEATSVTGHRGGLILTDASGEAVAEFAVAEGFAYEAVAPAGLLMALSAVD